MVGLANVSNASDADKPMSTATQTALDLKEDSASLSKLVVGLGNLDKNHLFKQTNKHLTSISSKFKK